MQSFAPLKKVIKHKKVKKIKKREHHVESLKEAIEKALYDWYITSNCETFLEL